MQRDGIVMELENDYAVVMTRDGQFCKLPRSSGMDVGLEVTWESVGLGPEVSAPRASRRRRPARTWNRLGLASAAACLLVAAGVWFVNQSLHPTQAEAYAFVSLDINPSVSLQVDQYEKVLNAYGNNSDGTQLLAHLHVKQESLQQAVKQIVDAAVADNMLPSNDTILVTAAPSGKNVNVEQIQQKAAQSVEEAVQNNAGAVQKHPKVYTLGLSNAVWTAADHVSLSPGKFAAYLIAQKEGYNVSLSQLSGPALGTVLSAPDAKQLAKTLTDKNEAQLEKLMQQVGGSTLNSLHSEANNGTHPDDGKNSNSVAGHASNQQNTSESSGSHHPGKGHGQSGKNSNKGTGGDIQVQVGNTVINIPIQPLVPLTGSVNDAGNRGTDNSVNQVSQGGHESDNHGGYLSSGDNGLGALLPALVGHQDSGSGHDQDHGEGHGRGHDHGH